MQDDGGTLGIAAPAPKPLLELLQCHVASIEDQVPGFDLPNRTAAAA
jgi:hypothetical protein